jgi:hypothetical protein
MALSAQFRRTKILISRGRPFDQDGAADFISVGWVRQTDRQLEKEESESEGLLSPEQNITGKDDGRC